MSCQFRRLPCEKQNIHSLPGRDNGNDSNGFTFNVPLESVRIGIELGNVLEAVLGDTDQVL